MESAYEYRKRAREALDGSIFSNSWLLLLLAIFVTEAILSFAGFTAIGPIILYGPITIGVASYTLHLIRRTEQKNKIEPLLDGFRGNVGTNILV